MRPAFVLLTTVVLATAACATSQSGAKESAPKAESPSQSTDRTRLTAAELDASKFATPYDVVDRLRREWWRDPLTRLEVSVYLDNQKLPNGRAALREVPLVEVAELLYLTGEQARARWGDDARGGAIVVIRRAR